VNFLVDAAALPRFRKNLLDWFARSKRDLPWRRTRDPYGIWLSEIMLQQTRVAAAIPYYLRFMERFPNVQSLAEAPQEEVLRLWAGLGYYSRARNLQRAAQQMVEKHGGKFPVDAADALALSGVGKYTAAAILSIAYGQKLAVLDGNVARVIARLNATQGDLREAARWAKLQKTADVLLDSDTPGDWNEAMMELGATVCTPRAPQCLLCPVSEFCKARKQGLAEGIPEKRKKRATVKITLASAVFVDDEGNTLLLPPPKSRNKSAHGENVSALLSRMWHFPTTEVHHEEGGELRKFLRAGFLRGGTRILKLLPCTPVQHAVTFRSITLLPFLVSVAKLPCVSKVKILPLSDMTSVAISNLTRKTARSAFNSLR